ncbi:MAG: DmsE family decaheme c-type cytochrome [bacterium]
MFEGAHGNPDNPHSPFGAGQLQCEACHGPAGLHAGRVPRRQSRPPVPVFGDTSKATIQIQNQACANCHQTHSHAALLTSNHQDLACVSCHTSHSERDQVLQTSTLTDVCLTCHQTERAAQRKPFRHMFGERFDCSSCHSVHNASGPQNLIRPTLNQTCYQCHAEKRGPFLWEHAPVTEDCSACHDAHGSNHPGMLTRRNPFLCQACHSQAGHPSIVSHPGNLVQPDRAQFLSGANCMNCHSQIHGSNHPSGARLMR